MLRVCPNLNVLFLAAEAEPFVKIGGLGDVASSLPRYLNSLSDPGLDGAVADVRLVLPLHPTIKDALHDIRPLVTFPLAHLADQMTVRVSISTLRGLPVYFVDGPAISGSGSVYSADAALDADKYTFFSLAALELPRHLGWQPNIIHANDWHTALACYALLLRRREGQNEGVSSVLTVHNLPFMGPDVSSQLADYGLAQVRTGLPRWASRRPLALGLFGADEIVAVSPTYAREIQTRAFGCGLQGFLQTRGNSLTGILNGIDYNSYDPAVDPNLTANFGISTLERRALNKSALQARLDLHIAADIPVLGVVSRLEGQKGIDLLRPALQRLRKLKWQLAVLGAGSPEVEKSISALQDEFPDRVRAEIRYDPVLARQIYAGADLLVMPSRYEPCGLAQMIAMRYGCIPIVGGVGGLRDTVAADETGFLVSRPTATCLSGVIKQAINVVGDPVQRVAMQKAGMSRDFSWRLSAGKYIEVYRRVVAQAMLA